MTGTGQTIRRDPKECSSTAMEISMTVNGRMRTFKVKVKSTLNVVGIFDYDNGDKYEGHFKNGKKEGKGTMNYINGNLYDGAWENDVKNGQGNSYIDL